MTPFEFSTVFYEVAALLALASAVGILSVTLRQPLIVGLIAIGVLAGPAALGIVRTAEPIELLAELGVALLLFLVGLKLDLHLIRTLGAVAVTTGLGQVVFTSFIGFAICLALGLDPITSVYVAVALTFSSTIIIVKLLSDKRELDSLHGRIALGFLIVQDLFVVIAIAVLSALGVGSTAKFPMTDVIFILGSLALLIAGLTVFIRFLADPLLHRMAHAPELLVTFAIGWAALLGAVGDYLGLGKELGGLLAGVSLASSPYRETIASRLSGLRDFLLLFFFVSLGSHFDLSMVGEQIIAGGLLSVFVLVGNPLIVMIIMGAMGYRKRTGFLAGLTVAQISEFSLVFVAKGLSLGHVTSEAVGLVTIVGFVTIAFSTYMIAYSHRLYTGLERFLGPFERRTTHREDVYASGAGDRRVDVILFGLGRYGSAIAERLKDHGLEVLGVDFDPDIVRTWRSRGWNVHYADITDPDIWEALPIKAARLAVYAVPVQRGPFALEDPRQTLIHALRSRGYHGRIAVPAQGPAEGERLLAAGADVTLMPFSDAADRAVDVLLGLAPPTHGESTDADADDDQPETGVS